MRKCHDQQSNYFGPVPPRVDKLLRRITEEMMTAGCPMACRHNEVAPSQYEMSVMVRSSNVAADMNALFMEVANREASLLGLAVLFHEKPFAGMNGSGKTLNWSVGTDTGYNFFSP